MSGVGRCVVVPRFVVVLVVLVVAVTVGMLALLRVDWRPLIEGRSDLWSMITAAAAFRQGRSLYDATNLCVGCYPSPFTYLPAGVLPFVFLVGVDGYVAFGVFTGVSVVVFVGGIGLLLRRWCGCSWGWALGVGGGGLLLFPAVDNVLWGQSQLLLTGAVALALGGPPLIGGVVVGVAAYYKLYPSLLIVAFLLVGDRRRGWVGLGTGVVVGVVGVAVCGVAAHVDFVRFLPRLLDFFNGPVHGASNYSLRNFLTLRGVGAGVIEGVMVCMGVVCVGGAWGLRCRGALCYAWMIGMMVLMSPIVWRSYFLLVVPMAVVLYRWVVGGGWWVQLVYVVGVALALTAGLNLFLPGLGGGGPLFGVMMLCGLCVVLARLPQVGVLDESGVVAGARRL